MAKINATANRPKGPGHAGQIMVDVLNGQLRVRAWPRKRGRNLHPKTLAQMDWFKQANVLAKYLDPAIQVTVREAVAGGPFLPRDILVMAMAGRLFAVTLTDGRTIYPMAARKEVSGSLDTIGQTLGDVIFRNADYWEALGIGAAGLVLTSQGPGQPPIWGPGVGGAAPWQWNNPLGQYLGSLSTSAFAFKGVWLKPTADIAVAAAASAFQPVAGGTYRFVIAALDGTNKITALTQSSIQTPTDTEYRAYFWDVATTLQAGTVYALMTGRTNAGDTTVFQPRFPGEGQFRLPARLGASTRLAKAAPAINDVVEVFAVPTTTPHIALQASF